MFGERLIEVHLPDTEIRISDNLQRIGERSRST